MKLEKIIVKGLFGIFNHEIVLKEHITILISENGYGKTTILRMLNALFGKNIVFFHAVVFEEFTLEFSDKNNIYLRKDNDKNIYLNDILILNNETYLQEMLITVKNAHKALPEDISPTELIKSIEYTGFNNYKRKYNQVEIIKRHPITNILDKRHHILILNTDRVDSMFAGMKFRSHYGKARKTNNDNEIFISTLNNFFLNKKISVEDKNFIVTSTLSNQKIPLINLSSGEKHLFALFYALVFDAGENTFVLFDEPEISLHISWQKKFISTLQEIVAFKQLNILIATHAPSVVGSHWDLVVELSEPTV